MQLEQLIRVEPQSISPVDLVTVRPASLSWSCSPNPLGMTPAEARQFAFALLAAADRADGNPDPLTAEEVEQALEEYVATVGDFGPSNCPGGYS